METPSLNLSPWTIASNILLEPTGLTEQNLQRCLDRLLAQGVDEGDLYFQYSMSEGWALEDHQIKTASYDISQGVGIRAVCGEKAGLAYTDTFDEKTLIQSVGIARDIALHAKTNIVVPTRTIQPKHHQEAVLYSSLNPLLLSNQEKVALLREIDKKAHSIDPRVKRVRASLASSYEVVLILNSEGLLLPDVRPLVRLSVEVMVEENGRREQGTGSGGGRWDYQYFIDNNCVSLYTEKAVREALVNLNAKPAPAGSMPVVLGSGWAGVLLHEAVGHGLEGDFNRKKLSAYSGRLGEKVASDTVTVVDNGTLPGRRGSLTVDDEGTPTQCTTLIENGVLRNYMQDKLNARLMGLSPTGNGRRESFACLPMPRMTNTYMLGGNYDPEEIISSVEKGLYVTNMGGGQVDITSGQFVFSTSEAYLIQNGKITHPVKGATLIGNGPEVMQRVSMVGNDLELDSGVGTCGKDGQSVPVCVGQPTIKVDTLVVGGTSK